MPNLRTREETEVAVECASEKSLLRAVWRFIELVRFGLEDGSPEKHLGRPLSAWAQELVDSAMKRGAYVPRAGMIDALSDELDLLIDMLKSFPDKTKAVERAHILTKPDWRKQLFQDYDGCEVMSHYWENVVLPRLVEAGF